MSKNLYIKLEENYEAFIYYIEKLKNYNLESYISGATATTEKVIELAGLYSIMPKF